MEAFEQLGLEVHRRWQSAQFAERAFADIATEALSEAHAVRGSQWDDIVQHILKDETLGPSATVDFGEPYITVFQTQRFCIELILSFDGATLPHQHNYNGAAQVLTGSQVNAIYGWAHRESHGDRLLRGTLRLDRFEMVRQGDVVRIPAGNEFIHSLFNLEPSTVCLLIQTRGRVHSGPQFAYGRVCGMGWDYWMPELTNKRIQLLATLAAQAHPRFGEWLVALINASDSFSAFRIALYFGEHSGLRERMSEIIPAHAAVVASAMIEATDMRRARAIENLRASVRRPEHRLFLAALLKTRSGRHTIDVIAREYPGDDPVSMICRWLPELAELGAVDAFGGSFDQTRLAVVRSMLEGHRERRLLRTGSTLEEELRKSEVLGLLFVD